MNKSLHPQSSTVFFKKTINYNYSNHSGVDENWRARIGSVTVALTERAAVVRLGGAGGAQILSLGYSDLSSSYSDDKSRLYPCRSELHLYLKSSTYSDQRWPRTILTVRNVYLYIQYI